MVMDGEQNSQSYASNSTKKRKTTPALSRPPTQQRPHVIFELDEPDGDDGQGGQDMDTGASTCGEEMDTCGDEDDTGGLKRETRSKKLTSPAWEHFTKVVSAKGETKAECNYCKRQLSYKGSASGTSHLNKHIQNSCPGRHLKCGSGQTKLKTKINSDGSSVLELKGKEKEFNQDFSRKELVCMVVMHEYPLAIVEHIGFRRFVYSLNPNFKIISRNTLKSDVLKMYNDHKTSLAALLGHNESRVAVTADMWTASNQKKGFMAVTSHFIDREWVLRSRTLRFCFVPCPHTSGVIAKVLMDCLTKFSLRNKISSIVVDNCSTNDAMFDTLMDKFEDSSLMLGGEFLHMRCSAHILNLVVKDGLDVIESGIAKVRECISFWMSTPKRLEKFEEVCVMKGIAITKRMNLDCRTRWNSTFLMLQSALPFKDVFSKLKQMNKKMKFDLPSEADWFLAKLVCEKLEIFYKATKVFSGKDYPTSNLFFRTVCRIRLALRRWSGSDVEVIKTMAKQMIEKFDKYWETISGILAVATILDPRNKLYCVEVYFKLLYGDRAENEIARVRKMLDDLVVQYQRGEENSAQHQVVKSSRKRVRECVESEDEDEFAKAKKTQTRKMSVKCEVDHYLEEETLPDDENFDILYWWKNDLKYPTLRRIARDVLAIPVSTIASESAFSMGGRVVSPHRSRLHANTVEALMCLQNWIMQDVKGGLGDSEGAHACDTIVDDSEEDGPEVMDVAYLDYNDGDLEEWE